MFVDLLQEGIEPPFVKVTFNLLVPNVRLVVRKSHRQLSQFLGRKLGDCVFNFLHTHVGHLLFAEAGDFSATTALSMFGDSRMTPQFSHGPTEATPVGWNYPLGHGRRR